MPRPRNFVEWIAGGNAQKRPPKHKPAAPNISLTAVLEASGLVTEVPKAAPLEVKLVAMETKKDEDTSDDNSSGPGFDRCKLENIRRKKRWAKRFNMKEKAEKEKAEEETAKEEKAKENKAKEEKTEDEKAKGGNEKEQKTMDVNDKGEKAKYEKSKAEKAREEKAKDETTTDVETTDADTTDAETTDAGSTDVESTDVEITDGEPTDGEATDEEASGWNSDSNEEAMGWGFESKESAKDESVKEKKCNAKEKTSESLGNEQGKQGKQRGEKQNDQQTIAAPTTDNSEGTQTSPDKTEKSEDRDSSNNNTKQENPKESLNLTYTMSDSTRLIGPSYSAVVVLEHVFEIPTDPRPNSFYDNRRGILRVYRGPNYGNPHGSLVPLSIPRTRDTTTSYGLSGPPSVLSDGRYSPMSIPPGPAPFDAPMPGMWPSGPYGGGMRGFVGGPLGEPPSAYQNGPLGGYPAAYQNGPLGGYPAAYQNGSQGGYQNANNYGYQNGYGGGNGNGDGGQHHPGPYGQRNHSRTSAESGAAGNSPALSEAQVSDRANPVDDDVADWGNSTGASGVTVSDAIGVHSSPASRWAAGDDLNGNTASNTGNVSGNVNVPDNNTTENDHDGWGDANANTANSTSNNARNNVSGLNSLPSGWADDNSEPKPETPEEVAARIQAEINDPGWNNPELLLSRFRAQNAWGNTNGASSTTNGAITQLGSNSQLTNGNTPTYQPYDYGSHRRAGLPSQQQTTRPTHRRTDTMETNISLGSWAEGFGPLPPRRTNTSIGPNGWGLPPVQAGWGMANAAASTQNWGGPVGGGNNGSLTGYQPPSLDRNPWDRV